LVCNQQVGDFVAAAIRVAIVDGVAFINPDAAQALGVSSGDTVRVVGLQQG
jgi:arginine N-succinyltransferase